MPQVFISYAHAKPDQDLAARLLHHLESSGIQVWADSKLALGQNWVVSQFENLLELSKLSAECIRAYNYG